MKSEIQILSTKKLSELQRSLLKQPLKLIDNDFINIEYIPQNPEKFKNLPNSVIFTSQNAVKSLLTSCSKNQLNFKNIYCVGEKTKQFLEENNFKINHFEKYGADLAAYILSQKEITEVSFFCGDIRLDEIPSKLSANNIKVYELIVYKTVHNKIAILDTVDGVLFYSPSGIESYMLAKNSVKPIAFCIGKTTAHVASNYFSKVVVSDNPSVEDVIYKVNQYYV